METLQENQSLNAEYERNKREREMKQEIERLNNIIKEVREYIDRRDIEWGSEEHNHVLEILDKENE